MVTKTEARLERPPRTPAGRVSPVAGGPRFLPLYRQTKDSILAALQSGEWPPGSMIPSEMDLAQRFAVSQGTVRKAIDELAAEHLLVRQQGRGTFVASHQSERAQFRFLRLRPDVTERATAPQSRVVSCERARAPVEVARLLGLRPGGVALLIRRVLSFSDRPVVLDEIWLPAKRFRGLTAERLGGNGSPLYGLFESEFNTRMIGAREHLKAVLLDEARADLLKVAAGHPALLAQRVSFTYDEVPVEVRHGYYLTDEHHYSSQLI